MVKHEIFMLHHRVFIESVFFYSYHVINYAEPTPLLFIYWLIRPVKL